MKRPETFEDLMPDVQFVTVPTVSPGDGQEQDDDGFPCLDDLFALVGELELSVEALGEEPSDEQLVEAQRVLTEALAALAALPNG